MANEYEGPPMKELMANHALADAIIKHHDGPSQNQILDDSELSKLDRFVKDTNNRDAILREQGIDPESGIDGYNGSLASYVILKHGHGDVFDENEIKRLRTWFESGGVFKQ